VEQKLRGYEIIEATHSIRVENTTLLPGADITLKAKKVISFASGFAVNAGGTLRVQIDPDICAVEQ
jgi:hypothetical protein